MVVDYIIVGQGICGTFLSWNLLKEGKSVMVIDDPRPNSSTRVSSGVINPITGRKLVKTWMIDELLPFARNEYRAMEKELGAELLQECDILWFHPTPQMREAFEERFNSDRAYVYQPEQEEWNRYFNFNYGVGGVAPAMHIKLNPLVDIWSARLEQRGCLRREQFAADKLEYSAAGVGYDDIRASKLIFCNGSEATALQIFDLLPFARNKGEALLVEIPGLPSTHIYKHGLSIVPWQKDIFWVGSTYEWNYKDLLPGENFRKQATTQLENWLKLPFKVVDHLAAERPATVERRPFVGLHPLHPAIGILNGMGTKGVSLAPYFARQLTRHLLYNEPITPQADVQRFRGVLSRPA